jgi:hypothetical protein
VGADGEGRRLRGQAERRQPPSHRVRLRHGAHDPTRAGTAGAHEDLDRERRPAWTDPRSRGSPPSPRDRA